MKVLKNEEHKYWKKDERCTQVLKKDVHVHKYWKKMKDVHKYWKKDVHKHWKKMYTSIEKKDFHKMVNISPPYFEQYSFRSFIYFVGTSLVFFSLFIKLTWAYGQSNI